MKKLHAVAFIATTLAMVGCGQSTDSEQPAVAQPRPTVNEVAHQYGEALEGTKELAGETKDQFVSKMTKELDDMDRQIAELSRKAEGLKEDAKAKMEETIATLRTQRKKLGETASKLEASSGEAWKDLSQGFTRAADDLQHAITQAANGPTQGSP